MKTTGKTKAELIEEIGRLKRMNARLEKAGKATGERLRLAEMSGFMGTLERLRGVNPEGFIPKPANFDDLRKLLDGLL